MSNIVQANIKLPSPLSDVKCSSYVLVRSLISECKLKHESNRSLYGTKFLEQHFANQAATDQRLCLVVYYLLE